MLDKFHFQEFFRAHFEEMVGFALVCAIFCWYLFRRRQYKWMRQFDFSPEVEERLQNFGLTLLSLKPPPPKADNPFKADADNIELTYSCLKAVEDEKPLIIAEYRIARCQDRQGQIFDLWSQIEVETGLTGKRRIRFRSENPETLPPTVRLILT